MSEGLNASFKSDPERFLADYYISVVAFRFVRTGVQSVNLVPRGGNRVTLEPGDGKINAYFLKAQEGKCELGTIPGDVDYFFTDTLTGCQFLAYRSTSTPTVEHNNKIDYAARLKNAQSAGWLVAVTPGIDYAGAETAESDLAVSNVVGARMNGNWQFLMQSKDYNHHLTVRKLAWHGG